MLQDIWLQEPQFFVEKKKKLPDPNKKNVLITAALPYVNNVPHLGNIIGSTLSADVFSRYCRIRDYQTLYVSGTDEYGTATEMKAMKEGVSPKEICDKFFKLHKEIYEWFGIDFDYFGRTSTQFQTEITQEIFMKIYENGHTSKSTLEQLHCEQCDKFLADRYVFGICPHCKYDDARGDQCDGCGKLLDAVELLNPKCHICSDTPKIKKSEHIFLNLDELSAEVEKHFNEKINRKNHHWSSNAIAIVCSWLKSGLEKRCITRDLKWGIPVPLAGFESKVFYVWFDATIGYLSITKSLLGDDWVKWWKNPEQVELYNFLGKDNVAFHAVIFPATQIATHEKFTIVSHVCATEYLNYENEKFSKSRGVGVFGDAVAQTGIPADIWRFYLVYMRPESQDTAFSWDDFLLKVNSELLSNLGNFVNRGLSFIYKFFDAVQPEIQFTTSVEKFIKSVNVVLTGFIDDFENVKLRDALTKVLAVSRLGNQYMQVNKPWELIKGSESEKEQAGTVVGMISNTVVLLSVMLYPFMPKTSQEIRRQCNLDKYILLPEHFIRFLKPGHKINEPIALLPKLGSAQIEVFKKQFCSTLAKDSDSNSENQKAKQKGKTPKNEENKNKKMNAKESKLRNDKCINGKFLKTNGDMLSSQHEIESLYANVEKQFEAAKAAFVANQVPQIEAKNAQLRQEVAELQAKLGYASISNNNFTTEAKNTEEMKEKDKPLAPKVDVAAKPAKKEKTAKTEKTNTVDNDVDVGRIDLRVGRIIDVKKHPDADSLYVETIDLGEEEPRTVVSGLVRFVPLEEMQNRLVICVCNLKPAKMRGIESQAMLLCASTPEKVEIMEVNLNCKPGDRLICEPTFKSRPDAVLNPKKKIWETVAVDLKVSADGAAVYKDEVLKVNGTYPIFAPTLRNVPVK